MRLHDQILILKTWAQIVSFTWQALQPSVCLLWVKKTKQKKQFH